VLGWKRWVILARQSKTATNDRFRSSCSWPLWFHKYHHVCYRVFCSFELSILTSHPSSVARISSNLFLRFLTQHVCALYCDCSISCCRAPFFVLPYSFPLLPWTFACHRKWPGFLFLGQPFFVPTPIPCPSFRSLSHLSLTPYRCATHSTTSRSPKQLESDRAPLCFYLPPPFLIWLMHFLASVHDTQASASASLGLSPTRALSWQRRPTFLSSFDQTYAAARLWVQM